MSKSALIFFALLHCLGVFPQSSSTTAPKNRHYFFTHFTTTSGLVSYQVNTALQDEDGYIWIGTNDGLQRFDGVRFKTFRHNEKDNSSLPSNLIIQLLIDKNKNLWILTADDKVGKFDTKTFKFSPASIKLNNEAFFAINTAFKNLITDQYGNIFFLVQGSELVTYNKTTNAFALVNNFGGLKKKLKVRSFVQEPGTHKYWLCTDDGGLAVYNSVSGQLNYSVDNPGTEKAIEQLGHEGYITNLYFDRNGRLWITSIIAGLPSISCYDMHKQEMVLSNYHFDTKTLGFHELRNFFEQKDGTLWVFGQKIFARYLEKEKQFEQVYNGYEAEHGIDYITITCLMEDREHNMWALTGNNGLFQFNPAKEFFSNIKYTSHTTNLEGVSAPVSFMPDKDGSLLVGTREDGFYRFDKDFKQIPLHISGIPDKNTTVIWHMCASADSNTIWMASLHGIYKYDQNKKIAWHYQPPALKDKTVKQILEDKNGNLWLGTQEAGVLRWDHKKAATKFEDGLSAFTKIPPVKINRIIIDQEGFVWAATNGQGAYMINPANDSISKHFDEQASGALKLPEQSALSVADYNDSLLIIGTNRRLMIYNRLRQTSYLLGGQLSGSIASIEKDDNGYLWVSTSTSIYRVTVSNRVFLQMNRNDGLENDYFLLGASYTLPDKRMLFGVYGVLIAFEPTALNTNPMFPDLKITGFMVKDRPLRVDSLLRQKAVVLPHDQNSIVIDLSILSYNAGYLLKYKLQGLDQEWKTVGQNYQLVFSYLPPGKYTLQVQTIDADGKKGEKKISLPIRINPPFWQSWWFYSSLLLLLFLFLFWVDRQRMKRRDTIQKMRSNIAGNLHREVNMALNNINILSEMAKLKADNNPEKSKEFIGQINIKSEHMIIAMDDMLWSIDPANDNMLKTTERLREFIETLNNGQNAGIEMLVDKNVEKLKLDMQLRHETLLLIREFIQAQVQCGGRNIIMHITYEKSNLVYSSQFNPETCNIKQLKNFLNSKEMEKRLTAIRAKLSVDADKNNVLVTLKFPVA